MLNKKENINQLMSERLLKRKQLISQKINPYPHSFTWTHLTHEFNDQLFQTLIVENIEVKVPGRVFSIRRHGSSCFVDIGFNRYGIKVQLLINTKNKELEYLLNLIDIGDYIGITGHAFLTQRGHASIRVTSLLLLTKSVRPLPNLKGNQTLASETVSTTPELDMLAGRKYQVLKSRAKILQSIRQTLDSKNIIEVETPYLNKFFGGAEARPFTTYLNALKTEVFLPVSPEIELKRAIVGGFDEGVYCYARNFRNEGIDSTHNPEFSSVEVYQPYTDYEDMMTLLEDIYKSACLAVHKQMSCVWNGIELNFENPWQRISVLDSINKALGIELERMTVKQVRKKIKDLGLHQSFDPDAVDSHLLSEKLEKLCLDINENDNHSMTTYIKKHKLHVAIDLNQQWDFLIMDLFERLIEPKLIQPCHVILHPARSTVLCKKSRNGVLPNGEFLIERFESYICGVEISNAYSELNDPVEQRLLVEGQAEDRKKGNCEAMPHNEFFLQAIEFGMPPTGGLGFGVDRMVMFLTNSTSIRQVIAFPHVNKT